MENMTMKRKRHWQKQMAKTNGKNKWQKTNGISI